MQKISGSVQHDERKREGEKKEKKRGGGRVGRERGGGERESDTEHQDATASYKVNTEDSAGVT